ncbi:barH-like 2 homeobox protein [Clytia hemisphaerica]|uniref:Homeobox domain-containing protein n=1 Tax=Clytia hemisphaerica TaxID=252671 RepID=A0A7M5XGS8_9CNID|eukprot:TCONS_00070484-protein
MKNNLSFSIERILQNVKSTETSEDIEKELTQTQPLLYLHHTQPVLIVQASGQGYRQTQALHYGDKEETVDREEECTCEKATIETKQLKGRRLGHPYTSRASPKRRAFRHTFTPYQVVQLEKLFEQSRYLSSSERMRMSRELKMTDNQLKTWYQNRRTKLKREITEMYDQQRIKHSFFS